MPAAESADEANRQASYTRRKPVATNTTEHQPTTSEWLPITVCTVQDGVPVPGLDMARNRFTGF